MTDRQTESLTRLLRCELTAVNQQFTHVLGLQAWGETETADRIMVVDYVDFPNAMRIADFFVRTGTPIVLGPDRSKPGADYRDILLVERAFEREVAEIIAAADCHDARAHALIAKAEAPRAAYAGWLDARIAGAVSTPPQARPFPETAALFGHLLAVIEQSLMQAFVHWHADRRDRADAAWASSGAAMMQATAYVAHFSARDSLPLSSDPPAPRVARTSDQALAYDASLAEDTARVATEASAACADAALSKLCRGIAAQFTAIAAWQPGTPHPAVGDVPPAFSDFEATLRKFVIE